MESKKWLWVVIMCLAIVAVHQIVKLTGGNSAESLSPEEESAFQTGQRTTHTASLAELPGMLEERKQPAIELAKVEEQKQTSTATIESSAPSPEEQLEDPVEMAGTGETMDTAEVQDLPSPLSDQLVIDTIPVSPATDPAVKSSTRGLVRGIVYSEDYGTALIDETLVQTGATVEGVKVVSIHSGGVEFEENGRRWTQKVGEAPGPLWQ